MYNEQFIFGLHYKLIGIINTPSIHHYNDIIINLAFKYKNLDLNKSYIYDGLKNNNEIIYVDDLKSALMLNNSFIGVYAKN